MKGGLGNNKVVRSYNELGVRSYNELGVRS